jgi:anti-anti-sigma factor
MQARAEKVSRGFHAPRRFMAQLFEENLAGITVLRISGSLTLAGLPAIEARLDALAVVRGVRVVADIGQVDAITTPAITVMLRTSRAIERGGGVMVFANANPTIARIFACCRLDRVMEFVSDLDAAMTLVRSGKGMQEFDRLKAGMTLSRNLKSL